tara:strand:- start:77 stop:421 length:345 start_codon:yes stop_codon:yes gene_type:complete
MATFPSIEPSYGFTKQQTPLKQVVKLGDGYEQRLTIGLNQNPFTLNLAFNNITETDADTIETFLTARADDNASFDFTAPGESASKKYVCDRHTKKIDYPNRATITCTFREVFEP